MTFGADAKRGISEALKEAKQRHGIVTSLSYIPADRDRGEGTPTGTKP